MALLRNPNLAVSASNVRVAHYNVVQSKGAFDVTLHLQPSSSYSVQSAGQLPRGGPGRTGPVRTLRGADVHARVPATSSSISRDFSTASTVKRSTARRTAPRITQQRTYNNTVFNAYNPYYLAALNLSVTQPLLKNFGMNSTKRQLKLAFINADAATAQTLVDASTTISQVENTYWDLVAAWRNVAIQEAALKEAVAQQQSNVRLAQRGAAAPIDAVESQTQVSNFQDAVYSALQNASHSCRTAEEPVAANAHDPVWDANLVPSTSVQQLPEAERSCRRDRAGATESSRSPSGGG